MSQTPEETPADSLPPKGAPNAHPEQSPEARSFKIQRSCSRRLAMQLLYALDTNDGWAAPAENLEELFALIGEESSNGLSHTILRKSWSRSRKIAFGTAEHKQEIDTLIATAAKNWTLARINQVDRAILRVAAYEMKFATPTVTPGIAINEAIEIAREYSQNDSWRFVNGVLDQIRKSIQDEPLTFG